jgi:hypothetical protein
VLSLAAAAAIGTAAVSNAQDQGEPGIAIECQNLLPADKQYSMTIRLDIDTVEGWESTLSATLLDNDRPDSVEISTGTESSIR